MDRVSYREHPPPAALAAWTACAWELEVERGAPDHAHRVLPDGCIDLVWTEASGAQIVGPNSSAFLASPIRAGAYAVGIRLRAGAAPPLVGVQGAALRDARLPPSELWGDQGRRLEHALAPAADAPARVELLLGALHRRALEAGPPDPLVREAIRRLTRVPSPSTVTLARALGVSERQLRRRTAAAVGYGPKRLGRVIRLQRALRAARDDASVSLAEVAYQCGYADQAHFTNECGLLAGAPPTLVVAA